MVHSEALSFFLVQHASDEVGAPVGVVLQGLDRA
jgi:hypothetical protein